MLSLRTSRFGLAVLFLFFAIGNLNAADMITFEVTPSGDTPVDNAPLTSAYTTSGVTVDFSIDLGNGPTAPLFELVGSDDEGFGFGTTTESGETNGPFDTPAAGFESRLGEWFLRPDLTAGASQQLTLNIEYTSSAGPVTAASGEIWDIEGRDNSDDFEQWRVTAFDSDGNSLAVQTSPRGSDVFSPLDARPWTFEFSGLDDIKRIEATYIGNVNAGIAFNNFSPVTSVPEPASASLFALGCMGLLGIVRKRS